jgi:hypothetical protein
MSVVGLPPTPLKPPAAHNNGVSSQILPLHRLSSESVLPPRSASGPPPPAYKEPPRPKTTLTSSEALLSKHKPVAEVSPFSSAQVHRNENPMYVFLFWELRGLSPNFQIHVSVSDLYITRIGPHIHGSGSGTVFSPKCWNWIRIRNQLIRIRNAG